LLRMVSEATWCAKASVIGEVARPGRYELKSCATVLARRRWGAADRGTARLVSEKAASSRTRRSC
jgi:hypothetical protein